MSDIYERKVVRVPKKEDDFDNIEERNQPPETVDPNRDSLSTGTDVLTTTVDFFQTHRHADDFNDPNGLFSLYDPDSEDRQYFDIIETEAIQLTSAPLKYYRLRHESQPLDPIYNEALGGRRDHYDMPVTVFGYYEDPSPMTELTKYGINNPETIDVWFNYNDLLNKIGHKIHKGDLFLSYDDKLWEAMTSLVLDESLWRAQHNNVKLIRVQPQGYYLPDRGKVDIREKSEVAEVPNE